MDFIYSFNYELYFEFSWIFAFISIDRWIKVEWPRKSQTLCTRKRFIHLCLITLIISFIQNIIYTFLCLNNDCQHKNRICEIFIHVIYITIYMIVPIALILISIIRTCLITLHIKKRFHPVKQQTNNLSNSIIHSNITITTCQSTLFLNSPSPSITLLNNQIIQNSNHLVNYSTQLHRRRSRLDTRMVMLISINVVPFILVHIITEIAYLFEKYSPLVPQSRVAQLLIILIYLTWYLISATRFYTNCLLSRIYREEFKNRLYMLRHGCKPRIIIVEQVQSRRHSSRPFIGSMVNGIESTVTPTVNLKSFISI